MRPVVVNDASCLIDLCKGDLLSVLGNLPYRLVVPLPVREFEILDFTDAQWHALDAAGLVTYDLCRPAIPLCPRTTASAL